MHRKNKKSKSNEYQLVWLIGDTLDILPFKHNLHLDQEVLERIDEFDYYKTEDGSEYQFIECGYNNFIQNLECFDTATAVIFFGEQYVEQYKKDIGKTLSIHYDFDCMTPIQCMENISHAIQDLKNYPKALKTYMLFANNNSKKPSKFNIFPNEIINLISEKYVQKEFQNLSLFINPQSNIKALADHYQEKNKPTKRCTIS